MTDSELTVAPIEKAEVQPVTPTEQTATPIVEPAATSQESKETADKEVSKGVQKRIDQVTSKYYAALDEKKQLAARVKELEENANLKPPAKEVSMFESETPEENAELANLQKTVAQVRQELDSAKQTKRYSDFSEFVGEMREKYGSVTDEEAIHIVEELNKDDVPPEAHGAVEKYFAAYERNVLATKLQEKEAKTERKAAVTEGKSVVATEHFPDDPMEALTLLKSDPAKYEELAKKAGRRG
jgi:glutamyl/glutaminyl-tRNA synthetase